jgi:hypothetical protein
LGKCFFPFSKCSLSSKKGSWRWLIKVRQTKIHKGSKNEFLEKVLACTSMSSRNMHEIACVSYYLISPIHNQMQFWTAAPYKVLISRLQLTALTFKKCHMEFLEVVMEDELFVLFIIIFLSLVQIDPFFPDLLWYYF